MSKYKLNSDKCIFNLFIQKLNWTTHIRSWLYSYIQHYSEILECLLMVYRWMEKWLTSLVQRNQENKTIWCLIFLQHFHNSARKTWRRGLLPLFADLPSAPLWISTHYINFWSSNNIIYSSTIGRFVLNTTSAILLS